MRGGSPGCRSCSAPSWEVCRGLRSQTSRDGGAQSWGRDMIKSGILQGATQRNVIGWTVSSPRRDPPGSRNHIYGTVGEVSIAISSSRRVSWSVLIMAMLMITVAITALDAGLQTRERKRRHVQGGFSPPSRVRSGRWRFPFLLLFLASGRGFSLHRRGGVLRVRICAVCVGVFVYKELTWKKFVDTCLE